MGRIVAISVINDLHSDQRVHRTCMIWQERGYKVILIGRDYPNSKDLNRPYDVYRFKCFFNQGPFFYLEYQLRLWYFLKNTPVDVYLANDLDTLAPNLYWSQRKNIPLVYDSHEYFLGSPEIESRPVVKYIWSLIERYGIPRVDFAVTVNDSIARQYHIEYGQSFDIVRNVPIIPLLGLPFEASSNLNKDDVRKSLSLPIGKIIWIIQGAGINIDRGAEELLQAAILAKGNVLLLIVGNGDAIPKLKLMAEENNLKNDLVRFIPRQNIEKLRLYTYSSDIGFSLDKPKSQNYRWSLPNKIFDYWQAGIPVVSSNIIEVSKLIHLTGAGLVLDEVSSINIYDTASMLMENNRYQIAQKAAKKAAHQYNWKHEKTVWSKLIDRLEGKSTLNIWSMDRMESIPYGGILEIQGQVDSALNNGLQVILICWTKSGLRHNNPSQKSGVYYQTLVRNKYNIDFVGDMPYIVSSRISKVAKHKSKVQKGWVLINGTHCTGIKQPADAILRLHNPEALYYKSISDSSKGFFKIYCLLEAYRLRKWENRLAKKWGGEVWTLTKSDSIYWDQMIPKSSSKIVGPMKTFSFNMSNDFPQSKGLLVPGKFSISENENAAKISLKAKSWDITWAGHGASGSLLRLGGSRVKYISKPNDEFFSQLLSASKVVLVHSDHVLGIKIKLIQALYQARWILAHENTVNGVPYSSSDGIFTYLDNYTFLKALEKIDGLEWSNNIRDEVMQSRKILLSKIQGVISLK